MTANAALIAKIERPPLWEVAPRTEGFTVRLIGSRMWEKLTDESYCRLDSDIDLVVDLDSSNAVDSAVDFLTEAVARSAVPIDAELSFPGLGEIHWKEWHSSSPQLLVKSLEAAQLISRTDLP